MSDNDDILNSIKSSFQSALNIVAIKKDIESEIFDLLSLVKESTSNIVYPEIKNSDKGDTLLSMLSAQKIYDKAIYLKSETSSEVKYLLCEYSLNKSTGFPVTVRYKNEEFSCKTIDILKLTLKNILISPVTAMAMANLFNGKNADY
ncbi:hypothetical protein [Morganella morganii]|uniref:hypothetical protein n=1 Tax=Morganella morganii TaxID=582 RepID=UPI000F487E59|nr:hypothetical protein [Morganella morganii]ROJ30687.1 hypothetical protein BFD15_00285 [Morganella morganii]